MLNLLNSAVAKATRRASLAVVFSAVLQSGCASDITNTNHYGSRQPIRPDLIYVYAFDSSPNHVKLDTGSLAHTLSTNIGGTSAHAEQYASALQVRERIADAIVAKLQSTGLRAIRSSALAPPGMNVLLVTGSIEKIVAGDRRQRMLIGLGAGASEVGSRIWIYYQPAGGNARLIESFDAKADSGMAPGILETAGLGAVTGSIGSALAVGGGTHAYSETTHDDMTADAKRLGDAIGQHISELNQARGWMAPTHAD